MPLQLGQRREVQPALHAHVLLSFVVLQLVSAKLTGVGETSTAHTAAGGADTVGQGSALNRGTVGNKHLLLHLPVWLHVAVLHHVSLQVAGLSEGLVAHLALVGPHALVGEQVCVQVAQLLKQLPTQVASVRLDAVVPEDVRHQVVLGGVGLLTHATLPPLLASAYFYVITVVHVDAEAELFSTGRCTPGGAFTGAMPGAKGLHWVERTREEVHDGAGHEEGVGEEAVVEGWEVGRMEEERRGRPNRGRTERLLFHLHR